MARSHRHTRIPLVSKAAWVALALALSGCVIPNKLDPVEGWPSLKTTVHRFDDRKDVRDKCGSMVTVPTWVQILNLGITVIEGCSWVDLCDRTCDVWVYEGDSLIEAHELEHCAGYDHIFDATFADLFERVKKGGVCK